MADENVVAFHIRSRNGGLRVARQEWVEEHLISPVIQQETGMTVVGKREHPFQLLSIV